MLSFNENKVEYLDSQAQKIIGRIQKMNNPFRAQVISGSLEEIDAIDLGDVTGRLIMKQTDFSDNIVAIVILNENNEYGLSQANYKEVVKLIDSVMKEKSISQIISKEKITELTIDWIANTYEKKLETPYSSYLINEIPPLVQFHDVRFRILYLHVFSKIRIGNVLLTYYTKDEVNQLIEKAMTDKSSGEVVSEFYKKHLLGVVYASVAIPAEQQKAIEIAYEKASLAIDVLKICSDVIDLPEYKVSFDIDSKTKLNSESITLCIDVNSPENINLSHKVVPRTISISKDSVNRMLKRNISIFNSFLLEIENTNTELIQLIKDAIIRFASALSTMDLHKRIVEIYTVLESLLLNNEDSPILLTLQKYCPKLIAKNIDSRVKIIEIIKSFYKTRSAMIHHGKRLAFNIDELAELQKITLTLITVYIQKTKEYTTKGAILDKIDTDILNA